MSLFRIQSLVVATWAMFAGAASAEVVLSPKHIYMMTPSVEQVYGSYVFFAEAAADEKAAIEVMLPKEQMDFGPQEGLTKEEMTLSPERGLVVDRTFAAGSNLMVVGFVAPAKGGEAILTLEPHKGVKVIEVMAPVGAMKMETAGWESLGAMEFVGRQFDTWRLTLSGDMTESISFVMSGVTTGRTTYWQIGLVAAVVLAAAAVWLAFRTRPKIGELVI
jgi:hypothetical protein